jgi:hypothetical protein
VTTNVEQLPRRRTDVVLVEDGRDSVLIVADQDATHVLNPTARAIWELCDGLTQPQEMIDAICEVFAVSPETARADVERALDGLNAADLISWMENRDAT